LQQRRNSSLKSGQKKYLNSKEFRKEVELMIGDLQLRNSEDELDND
jgi:hypothetical protein